MTVSSLRISSINLFPLKSGAGRAVMSARLDAHGLVGDRQMLVVDEAGRGLTARDVSALLTVTTEQDGDEIVMSAPQRTPLIFGVSEKALAPRTIILWGVPTEARDVGDVAAEWMTQTLHRPCRVVILPDPQADGRHFVDTAPILLIGAASLAELNRYLFVPAEMDRFRPNVVVSGAPAYDEDSWARIRIGDVEFDSTGPCDRCVVVTLDPITGAARSDREPLAMLGRQRRAEDGNVYFGQFMVPRSTGRISVGADVEILRRQPSVHLLPGSAKPVTRLLAEPDEVGPAPQANAELTLRCVAIIEEAAGFSSFVFAVTPLRMIDYLPGQFITLLLAIDGKTVRRNYTISSTPSRPYRLAVTVKRQPGGMASNWLHENVRVGTELKAIGPNGGFHLAATENAPRLLMLSAGSGITPMMAMLRFIADTHLPIDVCFHHTVRTVGDLAFVTELRSLQRQMRNRLQLAWNLTQPDDAVLSDDIAPETAPGRADAARLAEICPDVAQRVVLCCGPDSYRLAMRDMLTEKLGLPENAFHEESFGSGDAVTAPQIDAYRVSFRRSGASMEGEGTTTILELARKAGISVPSGCEAGLCGSCRCKLVSGRWQMAGHAIDPKQSILSEAEKAEGIILSCCACPDGVVEVDL